MNHTTQVHGAHACALCMRIAKKAPDLLADLLSLRAEFKEIEKFEQSRAFFFRISISSNSQRYVNTHTHTELMYWMDEKECSIAFAASTSTTVNCIPLLLRFFWMRVAGRSSGRQWSSVRACRRVRFECFVVRARVAIIKRISTLSFVM